MADGPGSERDEKELGDATDADGPWRIRGTTSALWRDTQLEARELGPSQREPSGRRIWIRGQINQKSVAVKTVGI